MLALLEGLAGLVERAVEWLLAALVAALVLIVASQLVDRHLVSLPMAAPDQYARVIIVWLTFTGFSLAVKRGSNLRVDLIDARLPAGARRWLEAAFDLLMLWLTALVGFHARPLLEVAWDQERLGTVLSEAWPVLALQASCVLLALFLILRLALALAGRPVPRASHLEEP